MFFVWIEKLLYTHLGCIYYSLILLKTIVCFEEMLIELIY